MESCLTVLEGSRSHARYDADVLQTLDPVDGAPLLARYDLERVARTLTPRALAERPGPGMWRWSELLPVRDRSQVVFLGEGSTPLLPAPRLGGALGIDTLLVKAEGLNPTGSFKARGMAAAVSRARELGVRSLVVPSAGNAGGALAAYASAAGIPATVVVPADTPAANIAEAQVCGARVLLVEGVISDCGRVARAIAERTGAFDVSTLKEPYRVEGKKTMGLELVEQLGWAVPDVIVYPTGGGTGLVGMWKAFDELEALGLIGSGRPRMVAAQAEGCAPIVRAFRQGAETAEPWEDPRTRASGLRVPSAVGDRLILSALRESGGTAVAVPEGDIDAVQRLAGRRGVGYVSPESATAFAALALLADEGWVAANERVVVFDCGVGHKYPPPDLDQPPVTTPDVADDPEAIDRLLHALRGEDADDAAPPAASGAGAVPPGPPTRPTRVSALAGLMARRRAERRLVQGEEPDLGTPDADPTDGTADGGDDEPADPAAEPGTVRVADPDPRPDAPSDARSDPDVQDAPGADRPPAPPAARPDSGTEPVGERGPGVGEGVDPGSRPAAQPAAEPESSPVPGWGAPVPGPQPPTSAPPGPPPGGAAGPAEAVDGLPVRRGRATATPPPTPRRGPGLLHPDAPHQPPPSQLPPAQPDPSPPDPVPPEPQPGPPVLRLPRPPHRDIVVGPLPPPPRRG